MRWDVRSLTLEWVEGFHGHPVFRKRARVLFLARYRRGGPVGLLGFALVREGGHHEGSNGSPSPVPRQEKRSGMALAVRVPVTGLDTPKQHRTA
jgi:hypothetical protein